jgi:hypothetical protein
MDDFENETYAGPSKCKRTRKNLMIPRPISALDKCKISDRNAIHIITACIEAVSLSIIDDFYAQSIFNQKSKGKFEKRG